MSISGDRPISVLKQSISLSANALLCVHVGGEHANPRGLLPCHYDCLVVVCGTKAGMAPVEGLAERVVQHRGMPVEKGLPSVRLSRRPLRRLVQDTVPLSTSDMGQRR